ncbi:MAG: hypothetical protein AAFV46_00075 [Cyanobacteria bacterium J06635_11]
MIFKRTRGPDICSVQDEVKYLEDELRFTKASLRAAESRIKELEAEREDLKLHILGFKQSRIHHQALTEVLIRIPDEVLYAGEIASFVEAEVLRARSFRGMR